MYRVFGVAGLITFIFVFVAPMVGPIWTWLDTVVSSFAAAAAAKAKDAVPICES